jgi:hypothetical protein
VSNGGPSPDVLRGDPSPWLHFGLRCPIAGSIGRTITDQELMPKPPQTRQLAGRHYHGTMGVRADLMKRLGGWPTTNQSDYDKQMLARCRADSGPPGAPCHYGPPTYVYGWSGTGRDHCSARIQNGRYRAPRLQEARILHLTPQLDASTAAVIRRRTMASTSVVPTDRQTVSKLASQKRVFSLIASA